jgi:hypothetical protein
MWLGGVGLLMDSSRDIACMTRHWVCLHNNQGVVCCMVL